MSAFTVEVVALDRPMSNRPEITVEEYRPRDGYTMLSVDAKSHKGAARLTSNWVSELDPDEYISVTRDGCDYRYFDVHGSEGCW